MRINCLVLPSFVVRPSELTEKGLFSLSSIAGDLRVTKVLKQCIYIDVGRCFEAGVFFKWLKLHESLYINHFKIFILDESFLLFQIRS